MSSPTPARPRRPGRGRSAHRRPHTAGDTLVAIANLDGIQLLPHLPDAPPRDVARCGMLPDVAPLLAWRQRQLPYVVVATDRLGAELLAVVPTGPDREVRVEGEELHVTRSAPGGWSQRRFQQRAENRWQQNAGAVAEALTRLVDQVHPRLVVVTGARAGRCNSSASRSQTG
jgi:Bacterial archaeo-eukaryotic release factor family 2